MSLVALVDGALVLKDQAGDVMLTAEEIYSVVFEDAKTVRGRPVDRRQLEELGIGFSDEPCDAALILDVQTPGAPDPTIRVRLGAETRQGILPVTSLSTGIADYVTVDNDWHPLPTGTIEEYQRTLSRAGIISATKLTLTEYLALHRQPGAFSIDDQARQFVAANIAAAALSWTKPPSLLADPYPYQAGGIAWLTMMSKHGLGALLTDQMGLGKTLQIIGLLLEEQNAGRYPSVVVCPPTLLENWRRELIRFAPSLKTIVHSGSRRTGRMADLADADIVVTSYDMIVADVSLFRAVQWNAIVLDEAQAIKNPEARRTLRVKELPRRLGVAVTGTPVENRLTDLWSLTDFVMPGYLGTRQQFSKQFPESPDGAALLEPIVSAIMLRRRVADVATDLPARIDIPVPLVLDEHSVAEYEALRDETVAMYPSAAAMVALTKLRMYCAHPWNVGYSRHETDARACSPKLQRCIEILAEMATAGEKALVFTAFNETAGLLSQVIEAELGVPASMINGSVPINERQSMIDAFSNAVGSRVLVLNPRAAGTGLNIVAANHVIHYTLEWNPAVEDQASARAFRRGQRLPVTVHRLFYVDTVEDVINQRLERKRLLAESAVVGTDGVSVETTDIMLALAKTPSKASHAKMY